MKSILTPILIIVTSYFLITSCANITPPTGGPRDTIAPTRILTIPLNQSINYKGQNIVLEFDERIKTDNIKDQLILTPLIDSDYEFSIKKNIIRFTFEQPFQDSTTYTLNFRESLQDITEGNPTKDNKFTFSTGSFLDSLSITGYVKDLLTYDTLENIVVGLYQTDDTINIYNGSPYYFTELNEEGSYLIENIKNGSYLLYAFLDENKNLKLETSNELYGFSKDTIILSDKENTRNIDLIKLDLSDFRIMTAITSGQYFDINLNKYILNYDLKILDKDHQLFSNRAKENRSIRFYNNFDDIDSLQIAFTAIDSINSTVSDTIYVKFNESKRKKEEFQILVTPDNRSSIETQTEFKIQFNKPVQFTNTDSIFIQYDTTKINQIYDSALIWNKYKDELSFSILIDKTLADTVLNRSIRLKQLKKDSLVEARSDEPPVKKQIKKNQKDEGPKINEGLQIYFGSAAFISADGDTSTSRGINYDFIKPEEHGIQEINVLTDYPSFILQFTDENLQIIRQISNQKNIVLKNIKPGNYRIRVLIDANNDGIWSPGNMKKHIEPEPVFIYSEVLVIRADWRTTLDLTF